MEPPQDEAQISRYESLTAFTNETWYQVIFLRQRQLKCESWALYHLFWHRPGIPLYGLVPWVRTSGYGAWFGPRLVPGFRDLCSWSGVWGLVGRFLYRNRRQRTRGKRVRTTPGISSVKKLLTGPIRIGRATSYGARVYYFLENPYLVLRQGLPLIWDCARLSLPRKTSTKGHVPTSGSSFSFWLSCGIDLS